MEGTASNRASWLYVCAMRSAAVGEGGGGAGLPAAASASRSGAAASRRFCSAMRAYLERTHARVGVGGWGETIGHPCEEHSVHSCPGPAAAGAEVARR